MKNIFSLFKFKEKPKNITLLTGGHLSFSRNIIKRNPDKEYFVICKNYDAQIDTFYSQSKNLKVFNCDVSIQDDLEELLFFIKKESIKVIFTYYLDV